MDWTGVAPMRSYGYVLPVTQAMVVMDTGQEELEYWRSLSNLFSLRNIIFHQLEKKSQTKTQANTVIKRISKSVQISSKN